MCGGAEAVGHAGDVVADDAFDALFGDAGGEARGQFMGAGTVGVEEGADHGASALVHGGDFGMAVDASVQEVLQAEEFLVHEGGRRDEGRGGLRRLLRRGDDGEGAAGGFHDIEQDSFEQVVEDAAADGVEG